jgi:hypothetical protein
MSEQARHVDNQGLVVDPDETTDAAHQRANAVNVLTIPRPIPLCSRSRADRSGLPFVNSLPSRDELASEHSRIVVTVDVRKHARHKTYPARVTDLRQRLLSSVRAADAYVERQGFRGYDPYDGLGSPVMRLPGVRSSRLARFGVQQLVKRSPVNVRPLLGIRRGRNPVTFGLMLQGYAYLAIADPERSAYYRGRIDDCQRELTALHSRGWSGDCWGYDFDWQSRSERIPPFTPTVVATGFVTNGLFTAYDVLGTDGALESCESACRFVLEDLNRTVADDGSFAWSYSPLDSLVVLNATMKGARLCAQVYSANGDAALATAARDTARFVGAHQRADGAWPYAVDDPRQWVDNHHTGYVLDAFDEYARRTGSSEFDDVKDRGWQYYREHFFEGGVVPKYYDNRLYPIDATACAQALLTLCRFGDLTTAARTADWVMRHMQRRDGAFVYQRRRGYVLRTPFMRWSVAWLFCALSAVLFALHQRD